MDQVEHSLIVVGNSDLSVAHQQDTGFRRLGLRMMFRYVHAGMRQADCQVVDILRHIRSGSVVDVMTGRLHDIQQVFS